jgi:2-oxoisovalerate dehydrogenase E1 component
MIAFTEAEIEAIENEAKDIVKAAHKVGMNSPNPSPDSIHDFVIPEPYVSEKYPEGPHDHQGEPKKLIEGLNETLKAEFGTTRIPSSGDRMWHTKRRAAYST